MHCAKFLTIYFFHKNQQTLRQHNIYIIWMFRYMLIATVPTKPDWKLYLAVLEWFRCLEKSATRKSSLDLNENQQTLRPHNVYIMWMSKYMLISRVFTKSDRKHTKPKKLFPKFLVLCSCSKCKIFDLILDKSCSFS